MRKVEGLNFKDADAYLHSKGYKLLGGNNGGTDIWNNRVIYGKGYKRVTLVFVIIGKQYLVKTVKKWTVGRFGKYIK